MHVPASDGGHDSSTPDSSPVDATVEPSPDASPAVDASDNDDAGSDAGSFTVSSFTPEREVVDLDAPLRVELSAAVDPKSVTPNTFVVKRAGRIVDGELSVERDVIAFQPRPAWALAASYGVELGAELRSIDGRSLVPRSNALQVREGRWSVEQRSPARQQPRSDLAVAPNGLAAVAWVQDGIQTSLYSPKSGWTAAERVSDEVEAVQYPSLSINPRGQLVASWNYQVNPVGRVYLPDQGWQPHFYFRGVPGGAQEVRRALWTLSDFGDATGVFSVYRSPPAEKGTVDAISFKVDSDVRAVHAISTSNEGYDVDPQLVRLGDQPLFAWVEEVRPSPELSRTEIWIRHGVTGTPVRMSSEQANARSPALAGSVDRDAAWLVWEEVSEGQAALWAAKLAADGTRSAPERIAEPFATSDLEANPALAIDAQNSVHVVWEQPSAAIATARFEPGAGWQSATVLSAAGMVATQPSIAIEPGGNALVVWAGASRGTGMDSDSVPVVTSRYVGASGWSPASELAAGERGASMVSDRVGLAIGLDHSGRAWASWTGNHHFNLARFD